MAHQTRLLTLIPWVVLVVLACNEPSPINAEASARAEATVTASSARTSATTEPSTAKQSVSVTAPASAAPGESAADEKRVRALLPAYRKASLAKDGKASAKLVSKKTFGYYDRMRKAALKAPRKDVKAMGVMDKLMVLMLRVRMKPKQLKKMNGRDIFIHAINKGWIDDGANALAADKIEIQDGGVARIGVSNGSQTIPPSQGFAAYREDGRWKIHLMSMVPLMDKALKKLLREVDPNEDKAILKVLGMVDNKVIPDSVFDPPKS